MDTGYGGKDDFKNKPDAQGRKNYGPTPKGRYSVGGATHSKGLMTIMLLPHQGNSMHGSGDFRIHGDSIRNPGTASEGCIIIGSAARTKILNSTDRLLMVVQ
ncbi:DUF2778 domain-containing protein [Affinibrenneria salicis]|uniref:DUF2778 domain-containing protein n=1 Tax=Affinibrenneria salicis TaxID=2590031 RepID=A0A5J5G1P5_9GAMM|nr:tlde1 domain-containing protein [Affinibrenneria salicis]KAA9000666.1 DUF2778 domain-containing protein [Affinibrenneria salicis]